MPLPHPGPAVPPRPEALRLEEITRTYAGTRRTPARTALAGVSLTIHAGEWVALLGPNGSGKSTLVRIISGTEAPDTGRVLAFAREIAAADHRARQHTASRLSIVFQKPGLDPLLTVRENLEAQAALFGLRSAARARRVEELASRLGLTDRMGDRVKTLSGGYQRRVDLARALLHEPELLILDEATTGLDHEARAAFIATIADLRAASTEPLTVVMTTHLMDEAERADRVVMMSQGRIVADGTPAALRAACGGRLVRVWPPGTAEAEALCRTLSACGLAIVSAGGPHIIARDPAEADEARGPRPALERAVVELARLGAPFEVAPPNLGDAYLAITGRALGDGDAEGRR